MRTLLKVELLEDRLVPAMVVAKPLSAIPITAVSTGHTVAVSTMVQSNLTTQNGLAPEYMEALAKDLQSSDWLHMPHMADDDFVRHFAQTIQSFVTASPKFTAPEVKAAPAVVAP